MIQNSIVPFSTLGVTSEIWKHVGHFIQMLEWDLSKIYNHEDL